MPDDVPTLTPEQQAFLASFDASKLNPEQLAFFQANFLKLDSGQLALLSTYDILKLSPAQLGLLASVKPDTDPNTFMVQGFPVLLGMTPNIDPKNTLQVFATLMNLGINTYSQEGYTVPGAAAWAIVNAGRQIHDATGDSGFEAYKRHLDRAINAITDQTDPRLAIALLAARDTLRVDGYFWQSTEIPKATEEYLNKYDKRDAATVVNSVVTSLGGTQGMDPRVLQHLTTSLSGIDPKVLKRFDLNLRMQGLSLASDASNVDSCARQIAEALAAAAEGLSPADKQKLGEVLATLGSQKVNGQDYARISLFKGLLAAREEILDTFDHNRAMVIASAVTNAQINRDDSVPLWSAAAQIEQQANAGGWLSYIDPEKTLTPQQIKQAADNGVALFASGSAILSADARQSLMDSFVEKLKAHKGNLASLKITIIGAEDGTGSESREKSLSQARALEEQRILLEAARRTGVNLDGRIQIVTQGQGNAQAGRRDQRQRVAHVVFS